MSHTISDMESAPVPATGLPTHEIQPAQLAHTTYDEKDDGTLGGHDVVVQSAVQILEGDEPTDEEYNTLRKVPAKMSWTVIAMCTLELAERASYYGVQGCFANFVRGPLPPGGNGAGAVAKGPAGENQSAGALGMGSVAATATGQTFTFLAYVIPILGGILADTKWGRFKTVCIGTAVGAIAHILLVIPAIPSVIAGGHAYVAFIIPVIILAFASGFIKPSVAPMLCDQCPVKRPTLQTTKSGERVVVDPQTSIARYMQVFYWCINVGSFFGVATTYSERLVGFWLAFLTPGIFYMLMPIVLIWGYKRLYKAPPQGSVVWETILVFKEMFRRGGIRKMFKGGDEWWNLAKPSLIAERDGQLDTQRVFWDDQFVDEIRQSLAACAVFFLIPIFLLADNGVGNQLNDMSAAMTLNSIPNDIMSNFNPLAIIIATPILTFGLYPLCEKLGFPLRPMTRMSIGFLLATVEMIICAIIQNKIYQTSPCGSQATTCKEVSPVNLAWQIPIYVIPAVGELFVMVTSYELAYTRAPARMKGLVYAICLFSNAIPAAIGLALSKVITDPNLVIPYYVLAGATFVCAFLFPTVFRHLNEPIKVFAEVDRMEGKQQLLAPEKVYGEDEKQ